MAKLESKIKQNPKLEQRELSDGRISLYLEYYMGRTSKPVLDEHREPAVYKSGKNGGNANILRLSIYGRKKVLTSI